MKKLQTFEEFLTEGSFFNVKYCKHINFILANPLPYKTPFYISFKKGTKEADVEALLKAAEKEHKAISKMKRTYGTGTYGALTLELDKPNHEGLTWIFQALDEFYGNNGDSMGWFGDIAESTINESGTIKIGNAISDDLTDFLKTIVLTKAKGYVHNERDAAALLLDIIKHRYNF
jgi:hypothetical protein